MSAHETDPLFLSKYKPDNAAVTQTVAQIGGTVATLTPPAMGHSGIVGAAPVYPRFVMFQGDGDLYVVIGNGGPAAAVATPQAGDMRDAANSYRWFQLDGSGALIKLFGVSGAVNVAPIWGN